MRNQSEPNQSNSKKPEWFELLDGDAPSAQVTKVNKKLPIIAALVTGAVIASGALFAGASAENSSDQSVVASIDQVTNSTSSPAASSTNANAATSNPTVQGATPTSPSVRNPSAGVQAPGNNRGDDDDYDDDDRHERGEGRDRDHDDDD
jgi:hypothetical protein